MSRAPAVHVIASNASGKLQIRLPRPMSPTGLPVANFKIVYHLYIVFAQKRDKLLKYCHSKGVEAKIHYPKPMYLQYRIDVFCFRSGRVPEAILVSLPAPFRAILETIREPLGPLWAHSGRTEAAS